MAVLRCAPHVQELETEAREANMRHDLAPTDEDMDKQLGLAHELAGPADEFCPVCSAKLVVRNAELKCFSDMCRERCIESCDGC